MSSAIKNRFHSQDLPFFKLALSLQGSSREDRSSGLNFPLVVVLLSSRGGCGERSLASADLSALGALEMLCSGDAGFSC